MASPSDSGAGAQGAPPAQAPLAINAQYIRDLSLEVPNAPQIFGQLQRQQPDVNINLDVNARPLQDNVYEVSLEVRAQCKSGDTVAFVVELTYAGVFTVNLPAEHTQPVLLIECPRLLFPFARNILAEVTRDGGFPPLMLGLVDFAAMYQGQLQEKAKQQGAGTAAPKA